MPVAVVCGALLWWAGPAAASPLFVFRSPESWPQIAHVDLADHSMAVWRSAQGEEAGENLIVMVKPFQGTPEQAADVPSYRRHFPGAQIQLQATTVCGGHPALYSFMQADKNGRHLVQEAIVYVWGPYAYIAMYTRFGQQPALQAARSALVSFCPPGSAGHSTTSW